MGWPMNRALALITLAVSLEACVAVQPATTLGQAGPSGTRKAKYGFGVIDLGNDPDAAWMQSYYLVDPRTQVCVLVRGNSNAGAQWAVPVSCAKLKATVPEAAEFVTWDTTPSAP